MGFTRAIPDKMMRYMNIYIHKSKDTVEEFIAPDEPYDYHVYWLDEGWVEYIIIDKTFWIRTAFNAGGDSREQWDIIKDIAKGCGCNKIQFTTKRNPKLFERKFGFRTVQHKLEYKL